MGQFKPMVKMMTTEPTVELKLKKGGSVKKAMGGMMGAPMDASMASSMPARGGMMPVARPKRPSMAARRAAMMGMKGMGGMKEGGEMGPVLSGLSQRMSADQIRQRIADWRAVNPQTFMPAYFSSKGLHNVAKPLVGKTVLTEQGLEDIVAYLLDATKGP